MVNQTQVVRGDASLYHPHNTDEGKFALGSNMLTIKEAGCKVNMASAS